MSGISTPDVVLARPQNRCVVCGPDNPCGLHLEFEMNPAGSATATWMAGADWEGYLEVLHGGIICLLLDEAMAKAVIARGWKAMTVELNARYRCHVTTGEELRIRGEIVEKRRRRILTRATIETVDGEARAEATGTFLTVG